MSEPTNNNSNEKKENSGAIMCIVLSLVLGFIFGVLGVIAGIVVSLIFSGVWSTLKKKSKEESKKGAIGCGLFAIIILVGVLVALGFAWDACTTPEPTHDDVFNKDPNTWTNDEKEYVNDFFEWQGEQEWNSDGTLKK